MHYFESMVQIKRTLNDGPKVGVMPQEKPKELPHGDNITEPDKAKAIPLTNVQWVHKR